ncbi:PIG-L deacetylase family protein [Chitinasiproducens palmae]|uniref:PIG-L deacetylase family protein n=1 Tax=Chitinasiproducens palmae TaxID=1770053 RepID=UPI001479D53B|nr:PIG-L family deacetylase [Chitinasiproducens palmae]
MTNPLPELPDDASPPDVFMTFVRRHRALLAASLPLDDGVAPVLVARPVAAKAVDTAAAPVVMLISPHPDDECLVGGLAMRLQRESGFQVVNVAATLGSNVARQAARWHELQRACATLAFDLVDAALPGRQPLTLARRGADPAGWRTDAARLAELFAQYRPQVVICPHGGDGSATHIGTHALTIDALRLHARPLCLAQSEFWGTLPLPNCLLELADRHVADMLRALVCHRKEVARNPYHLRLPAWLADSVRRGGESVFGAGSTPPSFAFGALYRFDWWDGSMLQPPAAPVAIDVAQPASRLLERLAVSG